MTDSNRDGEIKNHFYVVSQFSKVPKEIIEEFLPKRADAITLKGITQEQMERSVTYFPENVLYLPDEAEKEHVVVETGNKADPFTGITADTKYKQLSIWDILGV